MDPARAAWLRKHAREPEPWRGPVHAAPLLAPLRGRILELGAGGGKVSSALPPDALALDWAALPAGRPGVLADARALPLRARSVDAVVAIHVLGHATAAGARTEVEEIGRVLRPGGVLVVEVFARGDARDGAGREVAPHAYERDGIVTRYFDEDELRALLAGFDGAIVREERSSRWGVRRVLRGALTRGRTTPAG